MSRDAVAVAHDVGALLHVPALLVAATLPVAWLHRDQHALLPLTGVAVVVGGTAVVLARRFRHARAAHRWPAVEVVAVGWLLAGLVATSVLLALGLTAPEGTADAAFRDPVTALFEGMSGITSTGLTMVGGREAELTATAQWWRSLLQWAGGVGMVVFALGFGRSATGMRSLYEAEGRHPDLPGGVAGSVRRTAAIYAGLTLAAVGALLLTEHDLWTALNHGLTGISTGGFNITGDSMVGFGTATKIVAMIVIVVGAVTFVAHHVLLVRRDLRRWWRLTPVRAQVAVLVGGALVVVAVGAFAAPEVAVVDHVFQWVTASATAGFASVPQLATWAAPTLSLLVAVMLVGAASGSTGGGLKVDRAVWLGKAVRRRLDPRADSIRWDGDDVRHDFARKHVRHSALLAVLWLATWAAGLGAMAALTAQPLGHVAFDVASALSNVGLSTGVVDAELAAGPKLVLVATMYLGRLELLAALALATQPEPT